MSLTTGTYPIAAMALCCCRFLPGPWSCGCLGCTVVPARRKVRAAVSRLHSWKYVAVAGHLPVGTCQHLPALMCPHSRSLSCATALTQWQCFLPLIMADVSEGLRHTYYVTPSAALPSSAGRTRSPRRQSVLPNNAAVLSFCCYLPATCLLLLCRDLAVRLLHKPPAAFNLLFVMSIWCSAPLLISGSSQACQSCRLTESC